MRKLIFGLSAVALSCLAFASTARADGFYGSRPGYCGPRPGVSLSLNINRGGCFPPPRYGCGYGGGWNNGGWNGGYRGGYGGGYSTPSYGGYRGGYGVPVYSGYSYSSYSSSYRRW